MPYVMDEHQKIGIELECADVQMTLPTTSFDTYSIAIIETEERDDDFDQPKITIVFEERKKLARNRYTGNPKIEVVTAPHSSGELPTLKRYLNKIVDKAGSQTASGWATQASGVSQIPLQYNWKVSQDLLDINEKFEGLNILGRTFKKSSGARLPQCNIDLYLDDFFVWPTFIKSMMDSVRQGYFDLAHTCVTSWAGVAPFSNLAEQELNNVAGFCTLALYTAICEYKRGGMVGSLGKDRTQPLVKVGVDDLVRLCMTKNEQDTLFQRLKLVIVDRKTLKVTPSTRNLIKGMHMTNTYAVDNAKAIKHQLKEWFYCKNNRYQDDGRYASKVKSGRTDGPRVLEWDTIDITSETPVLIYNGNKSSKTKLCPVTAYGNQVIWLHSSKRITPSACKSGKPILPRKQAGRNLVVAEVRYSGSQFTKEYWG